MYLRWKNQAKQTIEVTVLFIELLNTIRWYSNEYDPPKINYQFKDSFHPWHICSARFFLFVGCWYYFWSCCSSVEEYFWWILQQCVSLLLLHFNVDEEHPKRFPVFVFVFRSFCRLNNFFCCNFFSLCFLLFIFVRCFSSQIFFIIKNFKWNHFQNNYKE